MPLNVEITSKPYTTLAGEVPIAVFTNEKPAPLPAWTKSLSRDLRGALAVGWQSEAFEGKQGQAKVVYAGDGSTAILVGLGKRRRLDAEALRRAYGRLIQVARAERLKKVAAPLLNGPDPAKSAEAATVGAHLGNYVFANYRTDTSKLPTRVESLTLWEANAVNRRKAAAAIAPGMKLAQATWRVRDLVNTPANDLTPKAYAELAGKWCKDAGVKLQVLGPSEIKRAGMSAVMAVGGGSNNQPRFLIASHVGRKRQPKAVDVVLVGKGVCFDSGGISLKPPTDMWEMRGDMMGSAVVLSAICAAANLKLPLNIVTLTPLVENMPSGTAYRPGDVVRTMSGQTVEIISTDAEGRMILADALTYAHRYQPKVIIDFATLTGAIAVALGDVCCAVFTEQDKYARAFEKAADLSGEKVWRMPVFEEYDDKFKSEVADMKNSGGRYGGGPIAARILRKFIGDFPWVHVDIAGVDLNKGHDYCPKGASGFGARLLLEVLRGM